MINKSSTILSRSKSSIPLTWNQRKNSKATWISSTCLKIWKSNKSNKLWHSIKVSKSNVNQFHNRNSLSKHSIHMSDLKLFLLRIRNLRKHSWSNKEWKQQTMMISTGSIWETRLKAWWIMSWIRRDNKISCRIKAEGSTRKSLICRGWRIILRYRIRDHRYKCMSRWQFHRIRWTK